uniref:Membrane magnesium transporter n=1 Tax=Culicoides sonorensis TaxID=179676 RepID=A0A336K0A1_CULSO
MEFNFFKFLLLIGLSSLFHTTYSAAQHRAYVRITEQEFQSLPLDIIVQALISLILVILSILQTIGKFKEIRTVQTKSWETITNLSSFYTFNHRGKSLFCQNYLDQL